MAVRINEGFAQLADAPGAAESVISIDREGGALLVSAAARQVNDATVGGRQIALEILDPADTVMQRYPVVTNPTASTTTFVSWGNAMEDTAIVDGSIRTMLQSVHVPDGWKVRVRDTAGTSAGDRVEVCLTVAAQ